jgi:NAD(P)-dependent dehydrogenase (short-subunit alcohol dehydrogenase family)
VISGSPVAVVTGAGNGIGRATAACLAHDEMHVVCVDCDGAAAHRTAAALRAQGAAATGFAADVSRDDDCRAVVDVAAEIGRVRSLCNVAGISPFATSITQVDEAEWDRVFAVNVKSIFLMSRACLPHMEASLAPVIVNVSSVHAFAAMPESAPYAASKGAIVALTRQMAVDLATVGVRVVAVAPGAIDTQLTHAGAEALGMSLDELGFTKDQRRLGWLGEPEDVAQAISWLVSDRARFINGSTLTVDGGLIAQLPAVR